MDFIRLAYKENKDGTREFYPSLRVDSNTQDLVTRGGQFAAIWDEDTGLYCRDVAEAAHLIDRHMYRLLQGQQNPGDSVKHMAVFENQMFNRFLNFTRTIGDVGPDLDQVLVFADQTPDKKHAASFKLGYSLSEAACPAWDEIVGTLYSPEERLKIEWAIGSVFTGAAAENVQKFYVFFGPPGSGKSTVLNIIETLFEGHTATFSAFDLGRSMSEFSLEPFSKNPLVAIDQDADLSRLDTNKNLNSIVSHDLVLINSKGKNLFTIKPRATLFIGTNSPVKISDRKSGVFRRLVDIQPTGMTIDEDRYYQLVNQIGFELGSIAQRCINVFLEHGSEYWSAYRSTDMMYRTNDIFNFVEDHRLILKDGVTLKQAHKLFLEWCKETETKNIYKQFQFRDLLKDYFNEFHERIMIEGSHHRSFFMGLKELEKFSWKGMRPKTGIVWLRLDQQESLLDKELENQPAQYATSDGIPKIPWGEVSTQLSDLDTSREHFVKVPTQHIVIDFDLKGEDGRKSLERNLAAASDWPSTYAEVSRGGGGLHLHYNYSGDASRLASGSSDGSYEVKTLQGNSALRRRLTLCNDIPVATISSGLPMKEEKLLSDKMMNNEKALRDLIIRALKKEIHPGTKSNMDFIAKVVQDAHDEGMTFDVSDMFQDIANFAMGSTNQRTRCIEILNGLVLTSEEEPETVDSDKPIAYFDCEVYPNLFAVGWVYEEGDEVVKMLNPTPAEVEELLRLRLIGYHNRGYDNHILWARTLGYDNKKLFELSQRIIVENDRDATFASAWNLAYADIYDFASEKKSLKKWQIELGIPHKEMDLPWDEPVPEDRVMDVLKYLENDVLSTRTVAKAREGDFNARKILAELSGLQVINTTRQHTERLIFGETKDVSNDLVYTDLKEMFPGYEFNQFASGKEKSLYKNEKVGEGGYVHAEPGMYEDVALLDVASMHPTSIVQLNLFGKYTPNFSRLMDIRLALKKGDYDAALELDSRLEPYLTDPHEGYNPQKAKLLSNALKIVINSVYGLTAASFPTKFKDKRNIDNIVAKRGALFMVDLKEFIQSKGFSVAHIKTDSVKIPNATPEIISEVMEFGKKYGYTFEHEANLKKFCLVNDAVYIALKEPPVPWKTEPSERNWEAVGAQFQHPVVFKSLFSKEEISPSDYVEVKQVQKGSMYLVSDGGARTFVGRFGAFIPVLHGRTLLRIDGEKEHAVTGTKDYLWETDDIAFEDLMEIDMSYYDRLVDEARRTIEKFGSYEEFVA